MVAEGGVLWKAVGRVLSSVTDLSLSSERISLVSAAEEIFSPSMGAAHTSAQAPAHVSLSLSDGCCLAAALSFSLVSRLPSSGGGVASCCCGGYVGPSRESLQTDDA